MASFGYDDDELREWRRPFDRLAKDNLIDKKVFHDVVVAKYDGVFDEANLENKANSLWQMFDRNKNGTIDFGEFIHAAFAFDVERAKEIIRMRGVDAVFDQYAEEDYMSEPHFYQLMVDFNFFATTERCIQKIVAKADCDFDGLVSREDLHEWVSS